MKSGDYSVSGSFLEHQGRKLFYLLFEPGSVKPLGSILFLPPFAEEMNKSRRIVACQARDLAAAGYRVMLLDLTGCGDAGGDFRDASWRVWLEDAVVAADALVELGAPPLSLWGLRLGALLACELAQLRSDVDKLVLWQPVLNGEQQIDQFLRLRTVGTAVNGVAMFDRKTLWNELREGRSQEIAGYELSSAMALELSKARLGDCRPACRSVHWLEVGVLDQNAFPIGADSVVSQWLEQGVVVDKHCVQGDPFWRTVDAPANPALQCATTEAISRT